MRGFVGNYLSGLDKWPYDTPYDKMSDNDQAINFGKYRKYLRDRDERVRELNNLILSGLGIGSIYGSMLDIEKEMWRREQVDCGVGLYDNN